MCLLEFLERIAGVHYAMRPEPQDVPCNETSDPERLCQEPLVSVYMLTYNQERFIAQAIEGVLAQRTDFPYELVIGDDASTDRTGEICRDYQRRYPDRIRYLTSETNQYAIGGNSVRTFAACRGKYIAYCEGDDFWSNPDKLRLQVEAFREHPSLGMCLMGTDGLVDRTGEYCRFDCKRNLTGLLKGGRRAANFMLFHTRMNGKRMRRPCYQTSGWLVSRQKLSEAQRRVHDIFKLRMAFDDSLILTAMAEWSDLFFIGKAGSVYRANEGSVSHLRKNDLRRDIVVLRIYWLVKVRHWPRFLAVLRYLPSILSIHHA